MLKSFFFRFNYLENNCDYYSSIYHKYQNKSNNGKKMCKIILKYKYILIIFFMTITEIFFTKGRFFYFEIL